MAGFSLGGAVNSASDWACNARLTRGVIKNPLFTALLIVALVVIVLMATYREPIRRGGARRAARAFVYGLLAVTAVMMLHNHAVRREAACTASQQQIRDVFSSIQVSRDMGPTGGAPAQGQSLHGPSTRPDNLAREDWLGISDVELPIRVGERPRHGGFHPSPAPHPDPPTAPDEEDSDSDSDEE